MKTTDQTYAERRATFIAEHAEKIPPDVRAALLAEQADLDAAGVPSTVLRPGSAMPDGDLLDVRGRATTLEQARAGRSLSMRQVNDLTFTVLSDPGNQIARQLGIINAPSRDARAAQLVMGIDVTAGNADGTTSIPMPTAVLTDVDGVIAWIDVRPDYSTRTEPADILTAITAVLDRPVPAGG